MAARDLPSADWHRSQDGFRDFQCAHVLQDVVDPEDIHAEARPSAVAASVGPSRSLISAYPVIAARKALRDAPITSGRSSMRNSAIRLMRERLCLRSSQIRFPGQMRFAPAHAAGYRPGK